MMCILVSKNKKKLLQASYNTFVLEAVSGRVDSYTGPSTAEQQICSTNENTQVYYLLMFHAIIIIKAYYGLIPPW